MKWLEIIEIRAVGSQRKLVESQLQDLIDEFSCESNLKAVKVYWNVMVDSDFGIHLFHDSPEAVKGCSPVCNSLVSSLKGYGLVNHTVWIEQLKEIEKNEKSGN